MPADGPATRRPSWIIVALASMLVALVVVVGGLARARRSARARSSSLAQGGSPHPGGPSGDAAGTGAGTPHLDEAADLVRRARGNPGLLIEAFAAWAGDPGAQPARRVVLGALAAEPQPMVRLAALLAAVEASPLAPSADPLARDVVTAVSSVWSGPLVRRGRDQMFAETRPRAREVVIASVVELALSDRAAALDPTQRSGLVSDFIDLYRTAGADQRRDAVAVVRKLGGNDTAELLQGNGLGNNSQLESHLQHQRAVEAATRKATTGPALSPAPSP